MRSARLPAVMMAALALAACSGGGGGTPATQANLGGSPTSSVGTPTNSTSNSAGGSSTGATSSTSSSPPVVSFDWPFGAGSSGVPLPVASAGTASFSTTPPTGVEFPLDQDLLQITPTRMAKSIYATSITLTSSQTSDGKSIFELKVPDLNIDAKLPYDGTSVTLADGSTARMAVDGLDYSLFALWSVIPADSSGKAFLGLATTGYTTPKTGIPANGTATYAESDGVIGAVYIAPQTGGVAGGTLRGDTNLTIDFSKSSINGSLSNMMITPAGSTTPARWNTVNLSGSLNVSTISGSAQSAPGESLPQNGYSFSVAYGRFDGYLYGPTGNEVGAVWTLNDSGSRSAIGVFGAKKQ